MEVEQGVKTQLTQNWEISKKVQVSISNRRSKLTIEILEQGVKYVQS